MKKYIVVYDQKSLVICQSLADAEEMILAVAESNIYENWAADNCCGICWNECPYMSPAEYIADNGRNKWDESMSNWAWALYSFSSSYWIDEAEEM